MEELMFPKPQTGIMFYGKRAIFLVERVVNCYEKDGWIVAVDAEGMTLARFRAETIIAVVRRLPDMPDPVQQARSEVQVLQ